MNEPLAHWTPATDQRWIEPVAAAGSDDVLLVLAFSGGGTRAAAFSYGVLEELAATEITLGGRKRRLLDEVDIISAVSGGSFPAAYFGLFGDRIFTEFEPRFLRKDVDAALIGRLFWPPNWFRLASPGFGRSDLAARYYNEDLFHGATFRDLARPGAPLIVINATDLATGSRFGFTQPFFDLICSDLAAYPVSHACAASSAVPLVLSPITLESFNPGCGYQVPAWLEASLDDRDDPRRRAAARDLESYLDPARRRYVHLVDGGIADNLGLRGLMDAVLLRGDPTSSLRLVGHPRPRAIVVIVVNAATRPGVRTDLSATPPSIGEQVHDVMAAELGNYDFDTIELLRTALRGWQRTLSTPERPVDVAFVDVSFEAVVDGDERRFLNAIGTSFALDDQQVDRLIAAGRSVLRADEEFQKAVRFLSPAEAAAPGTASNTQ